MGTGVGQAQVGESQVGEEDVAQYSIAAESRTFMVYADTRE